MAEAACELSALAALLTAAVLELTTLLILGLVLEVALIAVILPVTPEVSNMMLDKLLVGERVPVIEVRVWVTEFATVAVAVTVLC